MRKKSDKVVILLVIMAVCAVLSWIIKGGAFDAGEFTDLGMSRAGLYDLLLVVSSAFYYKYTDIIYILIVGGCYGVLMRTDSYKLLVTKASNLVGRNIRVAFAVLTILMGVYCSITSNIMALFFLVPFIYSVFIRSGADKLTAIAASFGGMFIGFFGLTFGTFGVQYFNEYANIEFGTLIPFRIVIFVVTAILYNLFAILHINHMDDDEDLDEADLDIYYTEEVEPIKVKSYKDKKETKSRKTAFVVSIIFSIIMLIVVLLAFINWNTSFNVSIFDTIHKTYSNAFKIADVPFFYTLIGEKVEAFGTWTDLQTIGFLFLILTAIVALFNKVSINAFVRYFGNGCKKISKVAFIYGFAFIILFLVSSFPWQFTMINALFGDGSFNLLTLLLIAFIAAIFTVDFNFSGYTFGPYIGLTFVENLTVAGLIWQLGGAFALVVAPTSYLLLAALTYADIPYVDWLKYIWKFAVTMLIAILIILLIVVYV